MTKQKILVLIPVLLIASILIYCWATLLTTAQLATWRHYFGLLGFLLVVFTFFEKSNKAVIATGIFLILCTVNVFAILPDIMRSWVAIGSVKSPSIDHRAFGLFILYGVLNFDTLVNMKLDYDEAKALRNKAK